MHARLLVQGWVAMKLYESNVGLVSLELATEGSDHVLTVRGELDIYTAPHFTAVMKRASNAVRIIVDLTDCRYLDASAITALVRARRESTAQIRLVLRDGSMVRRVIGITSVDRLFAIFSTVEAALGRDYAWNVTRLPTPRVRRDRVSRARR